MGSAKIDKAIFVLEFFRNQKATSYRGIEKVISVFSSAIILLSIAAMTPEKASVFNGFTEIFVIPIRLWPAAWK